MRYAVALAVGLFGCGDVVPGGVDGGDGGDPPPEDCDADEDGFFHPHPSCDDERAGAAPDCDDERDDVFPGAPVVCGDGAINNCVDLGETGTELGVVEAGSVADDSVFLSAVGGFFNNVDIAVGGSAASPEIYLAGGESASIARLLRVDPASPTNPGVIEVTVGAQSNFANNNVGVVDVGGGTLRLGMLVRDAQNNFIGAVADFDSTTSAITVSPGAIPNNCLVGGNNSPFIIQGLADDGTYYFELTNPTTQAMVVGAVAPGQALCHDLIAESVPFDEFGSQLVASGPMAIGRAPGTGVWTWELPFNFDELHLYATSQPVIGAADYLARNNASGDPVLMAFRSPAGMTVEAMTCVGLDPCTRVGATDVDVPELRNVGLAGLARGAALVTATSADFTSPVDLSLRFLGADGALLDGGASLPLGNYDPANDQELRSMDVAVVPPAAGKDLYDIFVALVIGKQIADQNELRLVRAVACQSE